MIDFTDCKRLVNSYEGADLKQKIEYDGKIYMLKFGQRLKSNDKKPLPASYSSTPVSEYLGSHIYEIAGLPVQQTLLGICNNKVVVACEDFIENKPNAEELVLVEFKKLENSYLGSSSAGGRTPLYEKLIEIFANHDALNGIRATAEERYWQMFAVDALIGNFDRHTGNWGYILNKRENRVVELAPVYDCGSSLYPQLNEPAMQDLRRDRHALENRIMTFPTAALRIGNKKVRYHEFLFSPEGEKARCALSEVYPRIDFGRIEQLIRQTPYIDAVRREFYANLIEVRREVVLQPAYELYRKEHCLEIGTKVLKKEFSLKEESKAMKDTALALSEYGGFGKEERDEER